MQDVPMALWVLLPVMAMSFLSGMLAYDRLVRVMHAEYHEAWLAAGKPISLFFRPPEMTSKQLSEWSMFFLQARWMVSTPLWIEASGHLGALWVMRVTAVIWNVSFFVGLYGLREELFGFLWLPPSP